MDFDGLIEGDTHIENLDPLQSSKPQDVIEILPQPENPPGVFGEWSIKPSIPADGPKPSIVKGSISIDIPMAVPVTIEDSTHYYNVTVTAKGFMPGTDEERIRQWVVPRRCSEFIDLHSKLSRYCTVLPQHPAKTFFTQGAMAAAMVDKRRVELQDMLCKLADIPFVSSMSVFVDFLRLTDYVDLDRSQIPYFDQQIPHPYESYGLNDVLYDQLSTVLITASENVKMTSKFTNHLYSLSSLWSGPKGINCSGNVGIADNSVGALNIYTFANEKWGSVYMRHFGSHVTALAWDLKSRNLFVGFENGQVCRYSMSRKFDDLTLVSESHPHLQRVDSLVFIEGKNKLVSCGRDSLLIIKDAFDDSISNTYSVDLKEGRLRASYHVETDYLYVGTGTGKLIVFDMSGPAPSLMHMLSQHSDVVRAVYSSPYSPYILTGGFDKKATVWSSTESALGKSRRITNLCFLQGGPNSSIKAVCICHTIQLFACGYDNGIVVLYHFSDVQIAHVFDDAKSSIVYLEWIPETFTLLAGSRDGHVRFYQFNPDNQVEQFL